MARQEDTCWRCGARLAAEEQPPTILRLAVPAVLTIAAGDIEDAPGAASVDADRWLNEGGTSPPAIAPWPPLARAAVDERRDLRLLRRVAAQRRKGVAAAQNKRHR